MPASEVMGKFKRGTLHSGSKHGPKVKSREQAVAIMMSEKKKAKKYAAHGSKPFTSADIAKGYKVCYTASDLAKLDDVMNAKMKHMKTKENHMKMEY